MAFLSIQYLRAVAAIMVVLFHVASFSNSMMAGVDLFFVISGFIMWWTTRNGTTPQQFMKNRLIRIVPLYWAVTLLAVTVALVRPDLVKESVFDLSQFVASMLFLPWPDPTFPDKLYPTVIVGWTLNYEMLFYVVFAFGLFLKSKYMLAYLSIIFLLIMVIANQVGNFTIRTFYGNPLIIEFILGVLIGVLATDGLRLSRQTSVIIFILGVAGLIASHFTGGPRLVIYGFPAFAIVLGAVFYEREFSVPKVTILRLLGDASYSIYLLHSIVVAAAIKILGILPTGPLYIFTMIAISCAAGITSYLIFEKPAGLALKRQIVTA